MQLAVAVSDPQWTPTLSNSRLRQREDGTKIRDAVVESSGKAKVLAYRLYYYLFFDMPSFRAIDHADRNTKHNIYCNLEPVTIAENTFRGLQREQKYVGQEMRCLKSEDDPWTSFVNAECAVLELRRQYPLLTVSQTRTAATDGAELYSTLGAALWRSTWRAVVSVRGPRSMAVEKGAVQAVTTRRCAGAHLLQKVYQKGQSMGVSSDTGFPERAAVHPSGPGRRRSANISMASRARV